MKRFLLTSMCVLAAGTAMAAVETMSSIPSDNLTVTDWYKQSVYDRNNTKIGDIKDVLVDRSGKINALIVGVGGFLGAGEKDVAVPFDAVQEKMKNNSVYLTLDVTKDGLKSASGFKYDKDKTTWIADTDKHASR